MRGPGQRGAGCVLPGGGRGREARWGAALFPLLQLLKRAALSVISILVFTGGARSRLLPQHELLKKVFRCQALRVVENIIEPCMARDFRNQLGSHSLAR